MCAPDVGMIRMAFPLRGCGFIAAQVARRCFVLSVRIAMAAVDVRNANRNLLQKIPNVILQSTRVNGNS